MDNMQTQVDHNAYSALFSDSEEPEAGELSALLADPDHGGDKALSIRELQEPSEAGGEKRSRPDLPQPAVVNYEQEEEKVSDSGNHSQVAFCHDTGWCVS